MPDSKENLEKWAQIWERNEVLLREIKRNELQDPEYYSKAMKSLEGMFNYVLKNTPVENNSGLVEMQKYFKILARKNGQII